MKPSSLRQYGYALLVLALVGCRPVDRETLTARASDQWTRSYPILAGGEFQIVGGNGSVDIRGGDADTIEVSAERIAIASTEASAKQIVPRIQIREDITPEKVVVQTVGLEGLVIGVEVQVNYRVTVPRKTRHYRFTDGEWGDHADRYRGQGGAEQRQR